ncbi:small secreted protein [Wenjunlia tyrosinilytica]|uniref:Small secreted protein n=1 Tax=Wenjunlia tyrosinilytica TaxID=1544741 RepID=A0A917ZSD1_9ACTN|nr:small secreted protein [Wenjunlia tyrosinilytica]GGO89334.1 hypothetical protein GCM10012280_32190 [Wenjunlia tyrosinilytica]
MKKKLAAALTGAALAALALTGCGGDDSGKKRDNWAKDVCDSVRNPFDSAQQALADIGQVKPDEKPEALKKRLTSDMDRVAKAYDQLAAGVNSAGAPPVDNGATLQKNAVQDLNDSSKAYRDLQKKVAALDTKDQSKFADGLNDLGTETETLGKKGSAGLDKLQAGDLGKAMAKQPGCKASGPSSTVPNGTTGSGNG